MKKIFQLSIFIFCLSSAVYGADKPDERTFRISKNLTIFNSLFRDLDLFYVDTLNYDKMIKSTIDNMLDKLDP